MNANTHSSTRPASGTKWNRLQAPLKPARRRISQRGTTANSRIASTIAAMIAMRQTFGSCQVSGMVFSRYSTTKLYVTFATTAGSHQFMP